MSVKELLKHIDSLDENDRFKLHLALSQRVERDCQTEATKAHKVARRRGITQATIDRAIQRRRYGE